jgi:integrase/recombinase XerD
MPATLLTTLKKLGFVSEVNRVILKDFYEYIRSKDLKSEHYTISLLALLISLDKFYDIPFTSINSKEQILTFLNHQYVNGKWVEREHDTEGKYISSFNLYLGLLKVFFRWLFNRHKPDEDWETPAFLRIKTKKPLRDSPYGISDIWELNDVLTIVQYEPELRNQAIITLLWDLDARPHEITALRIRDIVLNEQYGEGTIPSNTKTGGGPILLTSSFTYVRDLINKHPFKNEPNARLICNLHTGAPIKPETIWVILDKLRLRIRRLVESESGSIDEQQKQKLEYLLRVKKWNPYCFRHSAITDDSDHLPEYAVKKKARWTMNSQQGRRYIKQRMGDELKNKILERHGIKIAAVPQMVSRTCGRCGYVNKLESKYCEAKGCSYPLTQLALDEIKAAEQANLQELVNKSNLERDNTIQALRNEILETKAVRQKKDQEIELLKERMDRLGDMITEIDPSILYYRHESGGWYTCKYPHPLTDEEHKIFDEGVKDMERKRLQSQKQLRNLPDTDNVESENEDRSPIPIRTTNNFIRRVSKDVARQAQAKKKNRT